MKLVIILALLWCLAAPYVTPTSTGGKGGVQPGERVVYVGAVVEYEPFSRWGEGGGQAIIWENARILAEVATQAKAQGADILVIPEYGLQGLDMHDDNPEEIFSFMQYVPDPELGDIPCVMGVDPDHAEGLKILSCAALENKMYLVVDLPEASPCRPDTAANIPFRNAMDTVHNCPSNGYIYYNTQVVFDRSGAVIARYRKKNLFLEPPFTPGTESDDTAIFTTDFGVTFTLQVCLDIAYQHPGLYNVKTHGIKDVAMSTAWVDILPFLAAPSVQNGWSRELGVNLLVAGHHLPEKSKLGSGIFRGFSDLEHTYVYDPESGSKMIVSEVETIAFADRLDHPPQRSSDGIPPKLDAKILDVRSGSHDRSDRPRRQHLFFHDDLSNYTQVLLSHDDSGGVQHAEACHQDGLCCTLSYTPSASLNYSLLAYSGTVVGNIVSHTIYIQACTVVWCRTDDINSCGRVDYGSLDGDEFGPFTISGNFSTDYVYATLFTHSMTIADNDQLSLAADGRFRTMQTEEPTSRLLTGALFGRWYEHDRKFPHRQEARQQQEDTMTQ
ncbi:pantetheinase-like [Panulirus ornatus]|uniref:pantetheinase-like n=1 Tax=Panulirus ornatus TaxID=150431 RepID=UPI003A8706A0